MSSESLDPAAHRQMMIARAESRRGLLEQLSAMGMKAAERLANRTWAPEVGEEAARHGLAFAKVSRAVRLTLMLEARIDAEILALCSGVTPTRVAWLEPGAEPVRARGGGVHEREGCEARDNDAEARADREFERLPSGGFRACVADICDDLGIRPDWSLWSDEEGFVGDDGRPVTDVERWAAQSGLAPVTLQSSEPRPPTDRENHFLRPSLPGVSPGNPLGANRAMAAAAAATPRPPPNG